MNYQKIYSNIIEKAKSENRQKNNGIYYEAHHIIPKCLGGQGSSKNWKNHHNIILLTAKEHYMCHMLLCEIYPNNFKLKLALIMMMEVKSDNQIRYIPNSRLYEKIKSQLSIIMSNSLLGISKKNTKNYKKPKNKTHKEETKAKISESKKGKKSPSKEVICPYCNKIGKQRAMTRWHFSNCKLKISK